METAQADAKKFILTYGTLLGVLSVVLGVIMYVTNAYLDPSIIYSIIAFLVILAILVLGISGYKRDNAGYLSLTEAFKVGLGISMIAGIIGALWQLILMTFLEPDFMVQMLEMQREQILERFPQMSESQIDEAMEMNKKFSSPWIMMAMAIVGNLFFGFLIALVAGLIMKNKNPYQAQ